MHFDTRPSIHAHLLTMNIQHIPPIAHVAPRLQYLWPILTEGQQRQVLDRLTLRAYRKNESIYNEGERPDHLMAVIDGKVKIFRDGVGGRSQIIRVLRPVQYFGYRASLAREPYVTAAAAFEPSLIAFLPMALVDAFLGENTALCRFFITELATDLGISDRRTVSLTQKHVRGRLAESLLYLKHVYGLSVRDHSLSIRLTREDLASLSNMTTSNAIRTLSNFAAEGLVAIHGKDIVLLDEEGLQRISANG